MNWSSAKCLQCVYLPAFFNLTYLLQAIF